MPSEPRTIKGPCVDCNDPSDCWCGWGDTDICACHSPLGERTAPVPKGTKGVVVGVENSWFFVRFDGVQMTVSVIRTEIEKVEE